MSAVTDRSISSNIGGSSEAEQLKYALAQVFHDSQSSIASHRKQVVVLKQVQLKAHELDLDEVFNRAVLNALNRVLCLKKNEPVGDRIIRFISKYAQLVLNGEKDNGDAEINLFSRFVDELVIHAMKGLEASNKNVRYRCLQLLNHLLFQIDEISTDIYEALMELLTERLHDKDAAVRAAAIRAVARFQESDNDKEDEVSEAAEKLLIAIQNDPSADVRKAALLVLEKNPITINYLLERARDTNSVNRRLVFSRIMKEVGDFRTIDFKVREKLLAWGLRDREPSVSMATAKMFAFNWFETCDNDIMELVGRLHVVESQIADFAIKIFFQQRPDIFPKINFSQELWKSLNPESSFLIRCYYQYSNKKNFVESIDKNFPELIELASLVSKYLKLRKRFVEKQEEESNLNSLDFVIQQLLIVAKDYDYSDEIGRREMFQVLRSSLTNDFLPDKLIKEMLQVLRKISISERDFCQMITEVITDIRDSSIDDDVEDTFHSALSDIPMNRSRDISHRSIDIQTANESVNREEGDVDDAELERPQKKLKLDQEKLDEITLQCLIVTKRMLELTTEPLKNHFSIQSLVDSLIKPLIQCSLIQIRSLGIQCLGLVCLIDKQLSAETMYLLGICVSQGEEVLKLIALRVIFDILSVHGTAGILDIEDGVDSLSLSKLLYRCLRDAEKKDVQSTTLIGICKLYLADILIDNELFETLLLSYFGPNVSENEVFKQALSFCIPVYSFSHPIHQEKIMKISCDTFLRSYQLYENDLPEEERATMTPPAKILEQLVHFTDPSNVVNQSEDKIKSSTIHLELALELLEVVILEDFVENRVFKRIILMAMLKLKITSECDLKMLQKLGEALIKCENHINSDPTAFDLTSKNAFFKFKLSIDKMIEEAVERQPDFELALGETQAELTTTKIESNSQEQIDLERLVEEEIERSMIEPKEEDSDEEEEEDEDDDGEKEEEEEDGEVLKGLELMLDHKEEGASREKRRLHRGDSSMILEDSDISD